MQMTLAAGAGASILLTLGLILAVPDIGAVVSGKDADPVTTILDASFGTVAAKLVLLVIVLGFLSCTLAIQAASVRLLFSQGRDGVLPGSRYLGRVSPRFHMSPTAVAVAFVVPAAIVLGSWISSNALAKIISFATVGIYLGFQLVVAAALAARLRGWKPKGRFTLGAWGLPVNVLALAYGIGAIVNLMWRRPGGAGRDRARPELVVAGRARPSRRARPLPLRRGAAPPSGGARAGSRRSRARAGRRRRRGSRGRRSRA
jgi:amino acid transporter